MSQPVDSIHKTELMISKFLRGGVSVSGGCLLLGMIGEVWIHGTSLEGFKQYSRIPLIESINWAVFLGNRYAVITYLGLIILVSLPVIRVFLTAILFFKQKEKILASVAMVVFIALIGSFFLGIEL